MNTISSLLNVERVCSKSTSVACLRWCGEYNESLAPNLLQKTTVKDLFVTRCYA